MRAKQEMKRNATEDAAVLYEHFNVTRAAKEVSPCMLCLQGGEGCQRCHAPADMEFLRPFWTPGEASTPFVV